jgi:hypothetical protein
MHEMRTYLSLLRLCRCGAVYPRVDPTCRGVFGSGCSLRVPRGHEPVRETAAVAPSNSLADCFSCRVVHLRCGVLRSLITPSVFACVSRRCRDGAVDIVAAGFSDNQVALYV